MSATVWLIISIIAFALAVVCLAFSVLLFFRYDIPAVISDLNGKRAAREVAALRGDSEEAMRHAQSSGRTSDFKAMAAAHESKRLDISTENLYKGKVEILNAEGDSEKTVEMKNGHTGRTGRLGGEHTGKTGRLGRERTGKTGKLGRTAAEASATQVFETAGPVTDVLNPFLEQPTGITEVLNEKGATIVLAVEPEETHNTADLKRIEHFEIIRAVTEIHTEEYV